MELPWEAPCWRPVGKKPSYTASAPEGLPREVPRVLKMAEASHFVLSWSTRHKVAGKTHEKPWFMSKLNPVSHGWLANREEGLLPTRLPGLVLQHTCL